MTSPVFTPLQMFYSTSGLPLTDGYIYIGTASQNPQTNPIAVYWDAAGTIPAAQPIRTSGGYPVRNGSPATVFVLATDFSLIVRDKSSKLVFSRLSGNAFSAEWVTYTPAGTGAVATTVQAKLRESVSVKDFGVVGDGSDETAEMQAAFAAITTGTLLRLEGLAITISDRLLVSNVTGFSIDGNGAIIKALNGMAVASDKELLAFRGCSDFTVKNLRVNGNRQNRTPSEVAAHNIEFRSCHRFVCEQVFSYNAVVDGFIFNTSTKTDVASYCLNFVMLNCFADNCYRQGASVINAYDFQFIGGAYTNTNGIAPQAGIDVESDVGATVGNRNGAFRGVKFAGNTGLGLLLSSVSGSQGFTVSDCLFSANILGGVQVNTNNTEIARCIFTEHAVTANGVAHFANNAAILSGSISDCLFYGNTNITACIKTSSATSGVRITDNIIKDQVNGTGIVIQGTAQVVRGNAIYSCGNTGISASGADCIISENYIKAATSRGIYQVTGGAFRNKIVNNIVQDIASVSGGYIQNDDSGTLITGNTCVSTTVAATTIGIQLGASCTGTIVSGNTFSNLHTTQPIGFSGNTIQQHSIHSNIGGTENEARTLKSGMGVPTYTTGARPAATTVAVGQCIFNTTTLKPNWSNGTNWYDATGAVV